MHFANRTIARWGWRDAGYGNDFESRRRDGGWLVGEPEGGGLERAGQAVCHGTPQRLRTSYGAAKSALR